MNKKITKPALILIVQILIFGCRALSDHDEVVDLQRQLQVEDTWLPDQDGLRCTNDQKQEQWMPTHKSIPACCGSHFGWDEQTCMQNSAEWLNAKTNPFFSQQPQEKFYPDTAAGICRPDSPQRPEWMSILVSSYSQCCQEHIPWDIEKCMKGNAPVSDDVSGSSQSFYPDTAAGICRPDSPARPSWMSILVPSYSQCCQENFSWNVEKCMEGNLPDIEDDVSEQLYYPDTATGVCRPDSPARPSWMNILVPSYSQCCQDHLAYDVETCMKGNMPESEDDAPDPSQLFYPDTAAGICKPNSPERPSWMNILVPGYKKCCEDHLVYDFEKCMNNEPVIEEEPEPQSSPNYFSVIGPTTPPPTSYPTVDPYGGFYADASLRKCLPNSPNKPAWNNDVAPTHLECCRKYLDWAFKDCVADIPPTFRPTSYPIAARDIPDPTTSPSESPHISGFYADEVTRQCLPNSAARPEWNTNFAATHLECCEKYLDWAFAECVVNIPPSLRPTRTPTIAPTPKPTKIPVTAAVSLLIMEVFVAHIASTLLTNLRSCFSQQYLSRPHQCQRLRRHLFIGSRQLNRPNLKHLLVRLCQEHQQLSQQHQRQLEVLQLFCIMPIPLCRIA